MQGTVDLLAVKVISPLARHGSTMEREGQHASFNLTLVEMSGELHILADTFTGNCPSAPVDWKGGRTQLVDPDTLEGRAISCRCLELNQNFEAVQPVSL